MLRLQLFGRAQARYLDCLLPGFPCRKAYHVLCYLLLDQHHISRRDQLAAVFWGEYPTSTSRKYLRDALWRLRNALHAAGACPDEYLSIADDSVTFLPSSRYWLDIETFEARITRYQNLSGPELTPEQATHLEEAIDLCSGDLLEGIYEDWCLVDRERLNLMVLDALGKLVAFHAANGTYEHSLLYCNRILGHDNTREKIHRQMMGLYWQLGNRSAAVAQYKLCVQILRDVLDVPPMEETTHLYHQIKQGRGDPWCDPEIWLSLQGASPPAARSYHSSSRLPEEQILHTVHHLQSTLDRVSNDLRHIEHQLRETISDSPSQ